MKFPRSIHRIALAALVVLAPALWAQDGLRGAMAEEDISAHPRRADFAQRLVAADFDNDQKPDGALLLETGWLNGQKSFRIDLHNSASKNSALEFTSEESALSISAFDVNRDGATDIVVEQVFTHKRLQIWLNDGHGSFLQARSEDYPSESQSPTRWHMRDSAEGCLALWIPSKIGTETARSQSATLPFVDSSGRGSFWPEMLLAQSGPRAPNPSRGPPSLLSL